MAITMTVVGDVSFDKTAYELAVDYALRPALHFDAVADVTPINLSNPGTTITFKVMSDLTTGGAINQNEDISPEDMAASEVTLTLLEYGNAVKMSAVLTATGYILPYDPIAAELVAYNAAFIIDGLARTALEGGSNIRRGTVANSRANDQAILTADTFSGASARYIRNRLIRGFVNTNSGEFYTGFIHPDVAYDLMQDTTAGNWLAVYQGSGELDPLKRASIGQFAGINWIETARASVTANTGDGAGAGGNRDTYQTTVCGRQALAKGFASPSYTAMPTLVPTPVTDSLRRFTGIGWKWLGGYARYREASIFRFRTSSSIDPVAA